MKPAFMKPAFIRKNTPELRRKLEALGYRLVLKEENKFDLKLYAHYGFVFDIPGVDKQAIDCGTNEDLFLAVAALREDSDYMQWFIREYGNKTHWFQVKIDDREVEKYGAGRPINSRKATVEELIEHFKTK